MGATSLNPWLDVFEVYSVNIIDPYRFPPLGGAFSLIANTGIGSGDGNNAITSSLNTTGADLVILGVSAYNGYGVISDNKSNTWSPLTSRTNGSGGTCQLFYSRVTSVGTGHTFTAASTTCYPSICVAVFSGSHSTPYNSESGTTGSGTTIQPGSLTPSQNNSLLITMLSDFTNTSAGSINSSFNITNKIGYVGGLSMAGGMAYKIQTTAAADNPTWTVASNALSVAMAVFKPA